MQLPRLNPGNSQETSEWNLAAPVYAASNLIPLSAKIGFQSEVDIKVSPTLLSKKNYILDGSAITSSDIRLDCFVASAWDQ